MVPFGVVFIDVIRSRSRSSQTLEGHEGDVDYRNEVHSNSLQLSEVGPRGGDDLHYFKESLVYAENLQNHHHEPVEVSMSVSDWSYVEIPDKMESHEAGMGCELQIDDEVLDCAPFMEHDVLHTLNKEHFNISCGRQQGHKFASLFVEGVKARNVEILNID